jgi:DNA processing protein
MPIISEEQIIALLNLPGVGPKTASAVIEHSRKSGEYFEGIEAMSRSARSAGIKLPEFASETAQSAMDDARRSLDALFSSGGSVVTFVSAKYPELLRRIPNPPLILFCLGSWAALTEKPTVAVIGTREPSAYGLKWGRRIAEVLGEQGFAIVSGLAEGCDTAAHQGALDVGAPTVAFLAHGFGRIYPKANEHLSERIVEEGGCLVTEYLPNTPPRRSSFVERDRLQSGASRGIVVVETDIEGGTMHTVGFAKTQRRLIAALNHPETLVGSPKSRGNRKLIEQGEAFGVGSKADVDLLVCKLLSSTPEQSALCDEAFRADKKGQLEWY